MFPDRGHVWTHSLVTVSLLLCERKHLQNARSAVLQNVLHTCPVVDTRDQCLLVTLIGFCKGDPIERLIRDGVLSEKQTQLSRMFLDMAQIVEVQLQKADGLPL